MDKYILSPMFRKIVGISFKTTFWLIAIQFLFFLTIVFSIAQGWLDQDTQLLLLGSYIYGGLIFICIMILASYAIGYLNHLWKYGYRKETLKGIVMFGFLNLLTGYIWFYQFEMKNQKIRMF